MNPSQFLNLIRKYKTKDSQCTHWIADNRFKYNIPPSDISAVYTAFIECDPKPCLVEKIVKQKFPVFFDVDYKLVDEDKKPVTFDFGNMDAHSWFLVQRRVGIDSITKVIQQVTDQPFEVDISLRTCYKYHIYVTNLVVDEPTINVIRSEVIKEWVQHPEYQKCSQDIEDILDKKVYTTGLRVLGAEKTGLDDQKKINEDGTEEPTKGELEKAAHASLFGDLNDHQTIYPTVIGYDLNLTLLKKYSMLIDQDLPINVQFPETWNASCSKRTSKKLKNKAGKAIAVSHERNGLNAVAPAECMDDQKLMEAVRPFVSIPEIKLKRTLNPKSGTECVVLVEQPCFFKGSLHSRTHRNSDTMWILVTQHRAELRCYSCKTKCQLLSEYNPPSQSMLTSIISPCHGSVANVVFDYVHEYMAAVSSTTASGKSGSSVSYYIYDYNSNIWKEDQFYLYELISNPDEQLWRAYLNLSLDDDGLKNARNKLLIKLGTAQFRNSVMDMVGRKLIKKWHYDLGDVYFNQKLNQNRHLLVCENGTWDFKANIFRPGLPSDCSTISTERNYIPFHEYDIQTQKRLKDFIARIYPEEEEREFMMEQNSNTLDASQKRELVFILYGDGGNGKTVSQNLLVKATGGYAGSSAQSLLTQPPPDSQKPREDIMGIRVARNLTISELTSALVLSTMKVLSSHDRWSARSNNSSSETFYLHFVIYILTNEIPKIAAGAADNGTWRRLIFVPFRSKCVKSEAEIINPKYQFVGMQYRYLDQTLEELASPYLSYLIEYKIAGIEYPLPQAFLEEQERQKSKNSIYSRFAKDILIFPEIDPTTNSYIMEDGLEVTMMFMFVQFTQWLRMRKTSNQIDFDKFNEQMTDLLKHTKPPIFGKNNSQKQLVFPLGIKNLLENMGHQSFNAQPQKSYHPNIPSNPQY